MRLLIILAMISTMAEASQFDKFKVKAKDKFGIEQEYLTGYLPAPKANNTQYRDFNGLTAFTPIPKELDMRPSVQRIFRQLCGDCWAQGAVTAFETLISWVDHVSTFISRQQVIDCSGFGSCGGGQISLEDFKTPKGAVYESDYPYKGNNQKCKTAAIHQKAEDVFMVKTLTWSNLQHALMETGPLEVCGSSSALGNGGWVAKNPGGGTDHCYGLVGFLDGATNGHPAGSYAIIANSWGTNWGDNGYGYYLIAKDGENLDGNVITEAGGIIYKASCTPQPSADAGPEKSIIQVEQ